MKTLMRFLTLMVFLASGIVVTAQDRAVRKFNGFGTIAYSNDQKYVFVTHENEISVVPVSTDVAHQKLREDPETEIINLYPTSNDGELISILSNGISIWNYSKASRTSHWISLRTIIGSSFVDDRHVALITDSELLVVDLGVNEIVYIKSGHGKMVRSVGSSAASQVVVTGGGDKKVIIHEALTGRVLNENVNHGGIVRTIDVSPDGQLVASGDDTGSVIVTTLTGELKLVLTPGQIGIRSLKFSSDNKQLAAADDYGNIFIYSTENGKQTAKYKAGGNPIVNLCFSPDGKELSYSTYRSRSSGSFDVSRLNIAAVYRVRDQHDRTPPQIYISNPAQIQDEKVRVYKDMIDIRGTLMDESGVRGLRINGTEVPVKDNNNFVVFQALSMGDNPFVIEATDVNGNIAIRRFTVQRKSTTGEDYDATRARNYLFVVGIDDYAYWPKLNNAVKDASDISTTLLTQYSFDLSNMTLLTNDQATRANVYQGLRALIERVTPKDNLLIYFSGHGYFDPVMNEGYWIPVDARVKSSGDYLSNSDILKIIGNIDSQHTFLIADACFSGSLFSESKRGYAENVERYKSRWGLASGRLEVVSDGEIGGNSPFATATLTFLNENKKDKIAISELIQYVKMKVAETSAQTPLGNPLRVSGDEGGELVLYRKAK